MRPQVRAVARGLRPVRRTVRRLRHEQPLTLIGWHRIDDRHTDGLSTTEAGFERHLDLLEERGARVLPLMEAVERLAPLVTVNEVVPLGDQVVNGTTFVGLTERHTTVHTACALSG